MQKSNTFLERLDVRSLRTLKVLLDTGSVTKAGEAMAISQPAASRVLAQLRRAIGDPLLVRGRHGNTLTPRGESLRPAVGEALDAISSLFEQEVFEPSNTKLSVRVATTDHGATVVLAPLVQALTTLAPGITVEVAPWGDQTLSDLETGRLDLALDVESHLPENFHFRALFKEKYVCLVRQGHPLLKALRRDGSLNPSLASAYPQIVLLYPVGNRLEGDDVLARLGHPAKRIALKTPYFTSAPLLLANTDDLIFLPSRLGQTLAKSAPLSLIPLHADTAFDYRLIWHERTQKDAGFRWLVDYPREREGIRMHWIQLHAQSLAAPFGLLVAAVLIAVSVMRMRLKGAEPSRRQKTWAIFAFSVILITGGVLIGIVSSRM